MADENFDRDDETDMSVLAHVSGRDLGWSNPSDEERRQAFEDFVAEETIFYQDAQGRGASAEYDYGPERPSSETDGVEDAEIAQAASDESARTEWKPRNQPLSKEEGDDLVDSYVEAINGENGWTSGFRVSDNAHKVQDLKRQRTMLAAQLTEADLLGHPDLRDVHEYLTADLAYNSRPDPKDEEYADFVQRQRQLRENIFGEDFMIGADAYARAALDLQNRISGESNIESQYDLLAVRQSAALEHYNDPEFIMEVARHEHSLGDELLVDFDRGDLTDGRGTARAKAMSDIFAERVTNRPAGDGPASDKVRAFQEMREFGQSIRHDHLAIMQFATRFDADSPEARIGLMALQGVQYSDGISANWIASLSREERKAMKNDPIVFFQMARATFEKDFDAGNPRMAQSFAIMERSAEAILKRESEVRRLGEVGDQEDRRALFMFSEKFREQHVASIAAGVEDEVDARVLGDAALSSQPVRRSGSVERPLSKAEAAEAAKNRDEAAEGQADAAESQDEAAEANDTPDGTYTVDLETDRDVFIDVVDGSHVRLSKNQADAEAGKGIEIRLAGITAPPIGTQTKSGMLDAGEESASNLRALLNRYQADGRMDLQIVENDKGEKVLEARLPAGESLSQRMIRDGYALPTLDGEGKIRHEQMAKQAEAAGRGNWKEGFPELDDTWRSERRAPGLSAIDKREKLTRTVGVSMATTPREVYQRLSHSETKIFALPVEEWSANPLIDEEIMKIAKTNPGRLKDIYANNMDILSDLRKRKDKLTNPEKLAHDRLSIGRRALAKSLVETGHMTAEQARKDGHPMMSRKGIRIGMDKLRPIKEYGFKAAEATAEVVQEGGRIAKGALSRIIDIADER